MESTAQLEPLVPVAWCSICQRIVLAQPAYVGNLEIGRCTHCDVAVEEIRRVFLDELEGLGYTEIIESVGCGCSAGGCEGSACGVATS